MSDPLLRRVRLRVDSAVVAVGWRGRRDEMAWRHTREAYDAASKTVKGHEGRTVFGRKMYCACGWASCTYFGKGAGGQAAAEFREHKLNHLAAVRDEGE